MAGEVTVTYSERSRGWTSFWSFYPDWMLGMNSTFYTWKDGNLYEHDSNVDRNVFYFNFDDDAYEHYDSTITTVFNQDPTVNKMFKTIALDSTETWEADIVTDLGVADVMHSYYQEKEATLFAYIHNKSSEIIDPNSLSTQGVGYAFYVDNTTPYIEFSFEIPSNVSVNDKVYKINNNTQTYLGYISDISSNIIEYTPDPLTTPPPPVPNDMIYIVKNNVAESYGIRGYYMEVKLTNSSFNEVELFEIESSAFKSFP